MLVQTVAILGLASSALATYPPEALKRVRDLNNGQGHVVVEVRQAQSSGTETIITQTGVAGECTSSALSIITDAPTPSSALEAYFESFVSTADLANPSILCQVTQSIPQSLSAEYSAFDQQASSWFSKHSSEINALATKCVDNEEAATVSQAVAALEAYIGNGCSGTPSPGLAARPTGLIAGAVAAAGVLGAAVML
ncbi:hypothetical protein M434DRAFT_391940 [Hypoxylon sp. CO27-5]|nr:hypothetical protein M434DRAFT_391940 [Hypoxylon sp. CO27-5]